MRSWSPSLIVLSGFMASSLANAAEIDVPRTMIAPAVVVGNSVVFTPQQAPGGTVILRGNVPLNVAAPSAPVPQTQSPGTPELSSSSPMIGWDRSGQ
jgi:hypothetical protein